jgi:LPXTG-site transpeptidase (sortase) family protein
MRGRAAMASTPADRGTLVLGEPIPQIEDAPQPTRRERRQEKALSREISRALAEGLPSVERRRVDDETLGEYLSRVEAPRLPRRSRRSRQRTPRWMRRTLMAGLLGVLIGGAVALPWAAPEVPRYFADLVPGGAAPTTVEDPPVSPPADAFVGPVGVVPQTSTYDGIRLGAAGQPREVRVPRLHVDSDVVPISGQSGALLPPSDPQLLGWWQEGRQVGAEEGTAVITGHTVHTGGGALDHLDKLVVGDTVRVRTDNGWIRYAVRQTRIYSTDALARNATSIFRLGGTGRLVLITCDDWNGSFYESNAVVVATPVLDEPTVSQRGTVIPDGGTENGSWDPSWNMERRRGVVAAKA